MKRQGGSMPAWLQGTVPQGAHAAAAPPHANYVNRAELVAQLAPKAMPCFESRDQWITYLQSAAEHQRQRHVASPLIFRKGQPVEFNYEFFACVDCKASHAQAMWLADRCKPAFLMQLGEVVKQGKKASKEGADV